MAAGSHSDPNLQNDRVSINNRQRSSEDGRAGLVDQEIKELTGGLYFDQYSSKKNGSFFAFLVCARSLARERTVSDSINSATSYNMN
jgi:hypothetical protein